MLTLEHIYISPAHRFFGHHGRPPGDAPAIELVEVECLAGLGLRGDRFFGYRPGYKGQITLFSAEVFDDLREEFALGKGDAANLRRNLVVRGTDLNRLIGRSFDLQGVQLVGVEECKPCYWMESAIGSGAEAWLRGRGGLRCQILTSGWLQAKATHSLSAFQPFSFSAFPRG